MTHPLYVQILTHFLLVLCPLEDAAAIVGSGFEGAGLRLVQEVVT